MAMFHFINQILFILGSVRRTKFKSQLYANLHNSNFVPPADTAALFCLSFTNARVVSTIILFRCGRMAPTCSKRLGLKHATVHFRNTMIQIYTIDNKYVRVRSRIRTYKALL